MSAPKGCCGVISIPAGYRALAAIFLPVYGLPLLTVGLGPNLPMRFAST
jgi:hypothetical protein